MTDTDVKSTPLAAKHVELGARMVPFAGWNMPVQYTGILDEHNINIEYLYSFVLTNHNSAKILMRIENTEEAIRVLENEGIKLLSEKIL